MLHFDTILFPTDFSGRCSGAARYVKALSDRFDSRIILLHVLDARIGQPGDPQFGGVLMQPWIDIEERTRDLLDNHLAQELAGSRVQRMLVRGAVASTILEVARQQHADLMVIPSHGYGTWRRMLFGSTASTLLHRSPCPVLTGAHMDAEQSLGSGLAIERILCPLDLTGATKSVLLAAAEMAAFFHAELTLVHAVPGTDVVPERHMDCELRLHLIRQARQQLIGMAAANGIPSTIVVEAGDVADVVEVTARQHDAQLIVIGRNGHRTWWEHNSYAIARQAPCAVLAI
jgi:nucleotide-binding universal stress UspA family protein